MTYLDEVFGPKGVFAKKFPGYQPRPGQVALATAVDKALTNSTYLISEAPCGIGKSVAYSVPAIRHAIKTGNQVVIVTSSIVLQEQIIQKDLPLLQSILPKTWGPWSFALLKGRNNFLCKRDFTSFQGGFTDIARKLRKVISLPVLQQLSEWGETTQTGDVSELEFQPHNDVWRLMSTTSEGCSGSSCHHGGAEGDCFPNVAKRDAQAATVVVTNYHMLFAHLALWAKTGKHLLLPSFSRLVLDEVHAAADIARGFFGWRVTMGSIKFAVDELWSVGAGSLQNEVEDDARSFFADLERYRVTGGYKARLKRTNVVEWSELRAGLEEAVKVYQTAIRELGGDDDEFDPNEGEDYESNPNTRHQVDKERVRKYKRHQYLTQQALNHLHEVMLLSDPNSVYFMEDGKDGRPPALCSEPIDVGPLLRSVLYSFADVVVGTSATAAVDGSFKHVVTELGLNEVKTKVDGVTVPSPFDWKKQALLIVPAGMPEPSAGQAFDDAVGDTLVKVIEIAKGRTLALFTSHRALENAYLRVCKMPYRILKQGDGPRLRLLQQFKEDVSSVLLGTESFWTGVDVQGESCSVVFIDKLPFPQLEDPLLDKLSELHGRNSFQMDSIPRAVIAFKQGVGRLIRTSTDRGAVVICDPRLVTKDYGMLFGKSLPAGIGTSRKLESLGPFLNGGKT